MASFRGMSPIDTWLEIEFSPGMSPIDTWLEIEFSPGMSPIDTWLEIEFSPACHPSTLGWKLSSGSMCLAQGFPNLFFSTRTP
ncbi:hypothetical protein AVEN_31189-1 [Araneus ventricosus]|uniref:Uncharacterized protein n=1 Tax=Araneus ventricosus TaxID=182803 RepID=A0A4Y2KKF0_ARAVE|nr:hypothetical protein AVEN_31189-1 [Araneus ventricosus]